MEQQHRRDQSSHTKRNMALLLSLVSCLAVISSVQASLYLHRSLESTMNNDPSASVPPHKANQRTTVVSTSNRQQRTLLRDPKTRERSRAVDSSSANIFNHAKQQHRELDFIIAGFPKTGTTSLLRAFGEHPETDIASGERCAIINPYSPDDVAAGKLHEAMSELSANVHVKRGVKCPSAVYKAYSSIVRFEQHAPNTKFVVGLRHPVHMLQSFYNYRITELYDNQKKAAGGKGVTKKFDDYSIPPLEDLVGADKAWKGVSTDSTRFDIYLMQFGKTSVQTSDLQKMNAPQNDEAGLALKRRTRHLAIRPNNFSIFVYTLDQLEDTGDEQRSKKFRSGLQHFLGLNKPLKPVGRENLNHFVGDKAHPETIDICLPRYKALRQLLVSQGARSAQWIEHEFLQSPDVVVANREHFLENIQSWGTDPCDNKVESTVGSTIQSGKRQHTLNVNDGGKKQDRDRRSRRRHRHLKEKKRRYYVGRDQKREVIPVKL